MTTAPAIKSPCSHSAKSVSDVNRFFPLLTITVAVSSLSSIRGEETIDLKAATSIAARKEVEKYRFTISDDDNTKSDASVLNLVMNPILHWTNPAAGNVYGDVFVWTRNGRPEVVASFHQFHGSFEQTAIEFTSLSQEKLQCRNESAAVWKPKKAGVTLQRCSGSIYPATQLSLRLTQTRRIAAEFSIRLKDEQTNGVERKLRLMPQPVFRLESTDPNVLDGAMFAFVEGTAPETVLLIEARKTGKGFAWYYSFARMNIHPLVAVFDGEEVWQTAGIRWPYDRPRESFTVLVLSESKRIP
jgi:hypothetical protein